MKMRDLITIVESVQPLAVVDDDGDQPKAKYAEFDEDGEAHVRYWMARNTIIVQTLHASAAVRGRAIMEWLRSAYGKPIRVIEVTWEAQGFWEAMKRDGLIMDYDMADGADYKPMRAQTLPRLPIEG